MAASVNFPVIDFSDFESRYATIADQVLEASKNIGFFYITNHNGPSAAQFKRAFEMSEAFFTQPMEQKVQHGKTALNILEGYITHTPAKLGDKDVICDNDKETYDILPLSKPQNIAGAFIDNKEELDTFYKGMYDTSMKIFELLAFAMKIPANPETGANDYFTSRHRYDKPYATSILRFLRYPSEASTGRSESVVASEHTDYGTITLLSQRDIAGLQVDIDGTWTEIPIVHDAILVNMGGAIEYWTRGLLRGALHRVVATPELKSKDRYSIAFFTTPESGVKLAGIESPILPTKVPQWTEVPNDRELTSDEYMAERFKSSSYLKKKD